MEDRIGSNLYCRLVVLCRCSKKLTEIVYTKGDVMSRVGKIKKVTNESSIRRRLDFRKYETMTKRKLRGLNHKCRHGRTIQHTSVMQKVHCILALTEMNTTRVSCYFKAQKNMLSPQDFLF